VHKAFSEPLALLAGDGLIVMAYRVLLQAGAQRPERLIALMDNMTTGVGLPNGIVAGQAWECEPRVALADYQRAKTGALFAAATAAGAQAAGADPNAWRMRAWGMGVSILWTVQQSLRCNTVSLSPA
jgi:geranylgeranyl diphosphate synthase type II